MVELAQGRVTDGAEGQRLFSLANRALERAECDLHHGVRWVPSGSTNIDSPLANPPVVSAIDAPSPRPSIGRVVAVVLFNVASKDGVPRNVDLADESSRGRSANFYSFCQPAAVVHETVLTLPSKSGRVGSNGASRPRDSSI